ncbi:putative CDC16 [Leishmania infantum JPCM5]|uniref:CDC16_-_putative n=2 Tax=Leishmania infantum TaxID=5671 RepID=A0A6L0XLL1_LEIIN|nr:putative CDC16 [Leishmania infantum JPCM5]CAC9512340.1 CDC16_-_putative [Leishmania infantum]CAM69968.1 putative CDC16 [Leishmania infantum JPCM5]SUZ43887.1 CDC16_-_putative [Leishmania infantum]|eukprot:XP_001466919.1 putative CDC16 [Leishmania infantum JPCM5]
MEAVGVLKENALRLVSAGQPISALHLVEVLCELQPNSDENRSLKIRCLYELREFDSVLKLAKQMTFACDQNSEVFLLAVKAAFELGDLKTCVQYAMTLINADSSKVVAMCFVAKAAELSGDPAKAVRFYRMALEADPFCGEAFSALTERHLLDRWEMLKLIDSLCIPAEVEVYRSTLKARIGSDYLTPGISGVPRTLVLLAGAKKEYESNNLRQALSLTTEILEVEPYHRQTLCLHLCILVDSKATPLLFEKAHFLSKNKCYTELAVYAIGCFYYSLSNYERAGRYFSRASELDCYFAEAWIAYGHCYAKLEEGEQALNVYRRAMNFFPGLNACCTYVGMQYSRVNQRSVARCFFEESLRKNSMDPLVLNELGVLALAEDNPKQALELFQRAYDSLPNRENPSEHSDCILFNLATMYRKLRRYEAAIDYYNQYVRSRPNASHGHCALGFTYHLSGNIKAAISCYHTAESIKPDSFCRDLLRRALELDFGARGRLSWDSERPHLSFSPGEVSFSTVSRRFRSESTAADSVAASPPPRVGRSLDFQHQ